jgi:hypothetical protein
MRKWGISECAQKNGFLFELRGMAAFNANIIDLLHLLKYRTIQERKLIVRCQHPRAEKGSPERNNGRLGMYLLLMAEVPQRVAEPQMAKFGCCMPREMWNAAII